MHIAAKRLDCSLVLESFDLLIVTNAAVLLTDDLFLDGAWIEAANMVANWHPGVSLVLPARAQAADHNIGEVLTKPLRVTSLRHAVELAAGPV